MGFEPTSGGTTILCLNHLATLAIRFLILTQAPWQMQAPGQKKFRDGLQPWDGSGESGRRFNPSPGFPSVQFLPPVPFIPKPSGSTAWIGRR